MKKTLTPLTVAVVLLTGYSLNWLRSEQPRKAGSHVSAQDVFTSEAALRHKHFQPIHWRAMVLNHQ